MSLNLTNQIKQFSSARFVVIVTELKCDQTTPLTSFRMHKWLQTKMYTIFDTDFWHNISCPFTWCDPFCP